MTIELILCALFLACSIVATVIGFGMFKVAIQYPQEQKKMHKESRRFDGCGRGTERDETRERYGTGMQMTDDEIVATALRILDKRMRSPGQSLSTPESVTDYLRLSIGSLEHEEFGVLWLDAKNRLIMDDRLFRGTVTESRIYPREIVKRALGNNAVSCILYHNHPSGDPEPSGNDKMLTEHIRQCLMTINVAVVDNIIISLNESVSMMQRGLIY